MRQEAREMMRRKDEWEKAAEIKGVKGRKKTGEGMTQHKGDAREDRAGKK